MRRAELARILYDLGVSSWLYRLDGSHSELATVLDHRDSRWVVFLSERGSESSPIEFEREDQACVYVLGCVALDLLARNQLCVDTTAEPPLRGPQ
jgi:hypothetical protein